MQTAAGIHHLQFRKAQINNVTLTSHRQSISLDHSNAQFGRNHPQLQHDTGVDKVGNRKHGQDKKECKADCFELLPAQMQQAYPHQYQPGRDVHRKILSAQLSQPKENNSKTNGQQTCPGWFRRSRGQFIAFEPYQKKHYR